MNVKIKLGAYVVLVILAACFAWGFYANYTIATKQSAESATNDTASVVTNAPSSNDVASSTNSAATATTPAKPVHAVQGTMIGYLAALVGAIVGLGLLIAYDVTQYVGGVAVDVLMDDRGEGLRDPEYEQAEQIWANGKHMEAIEMMRDYLKKHPREQYAALRIAEIYEKDLNNPLASALEYEEVLKNKLPPERWGWAAVHLCNLYSKLGQQDKTRVLLQRIVDDYPQTSAAKKARNRLGLPEPVADTPSEAPSAPEPDHMEEGRIILDTEEVAPGHAQPSAPEPPPSNLPPGFRPKK